MGDESDKKLDGNLAVHVTLLIIFYYAKRKD